MNIELVSLRFVVFLSEFLSDSDIGEVYSLYPGFKEKVLPLAPIPMEDSLKEVPLATIKMGDVELRLARKRIDFIHNGQAGAESIVEQTLIDMYKGIHARRGAKINRISFIAQFFVETSVESATNALFNSDFKNIINEGDPSSFTVRYAAKFEDDLRCGEDIILNNFISLESGSRNREGVSRKGVIIQRDFNSDQGHTLDYQGKFSADSLSALIDIAKKKYRLEDWTNGLKG